jgi:hypothetical protein
MITFRADPGVRSSPNRASSLSATVNRLDMTYSSSSLTS